VGALLSAVVPIAEVVKVAGVVGKVAQEADKLVDTAKGVDEAADVAKVGDAGHALNEGAITAERAESAANGSKLNSQLIAEEVANGHALEKHFLDGEFSSLGIQTKEQFQNFIENIVSNPATPKRYAMDGTIYYLDETTRTIVIRGQRGEATAFRPDYGVGWENYLSTQVPKNTQPPDL
jgi:hypothetical protein